MATRKDVELMIRDAAEGDLHDRDGHLRAVLVEPDGSVLAWSDLAGHYTRRHDLTDAQTAEARRLAGLVWSGTHYAAAGQVFARRARAEVV